MVFPQDKQGFAIDDQYYIGNTGLLVKPVTEPGVEKAEVYLAEAQVSFPAALTKAFVESSSRRTMIIKLMTFIEALSRVRRSQYLHHSQKSQFSFEEDMLFQRANVLGALLHS